MSGSEVIDQICEEVRKAKRITGEQIIRLSKAYGKRVELSLKALKEGRVKKYVFMPSRKVVWVVVGRELDYQVIPSADFCTCNDFYFRVVGGEARLCYHLLAQKLAEALGEYDLIEEKDELAKSLMKEWKGGK